MSGDGFTVQIYAALYCSVLTPHLYSAQKFGTYDTLALKLLIMELHW